MFLSKTADTHHKFWAGEVLPGLKERFGDCSVEKTLNGVKLAESTANPSILPALVRVITEGAGVKLSEACWQELARVAAKQSLSASAFAFTVADIDDVGVRSKYMR